MNRPQELPAQLSPSQRLVRTREALIMQMPGGARRLEQSTSRQSEPEDSRLSDDELADGHGQASTWWSFLKSAAQVWWQRHPLHAAAQLSEPLLSEYARAKPVQLLVISAGVGAAAIVFKPWRLVSLTALLAAALRPAQVSGFVMSFLVRNRDRQDKRGY